MRIHATLVHRKASIFKSMGLEGEGGKFYKDAMNVDPSFSMPHFNLGILYGRQGKDKEGEAEYKKVLELDPEDANAHFNLGLLYEKQEKFVLAKQQFERALKVNPDYEKAKSGLERVGKRWKSKLDN